MHSECLAAVAIALLFVLASLLLDGCSIAFVALVVLAVFVDNVYFVLRTLNDIVTTCAM